MSAAAAEGTALSAGAAEATVAATAESSPGPASPLSAPAARERCANCDAPLSGPYCSQCGQRHEHAAHSCWHFIREVFEDFTHADSRLWRTLGGLLFRPGFLTREFLQGRRARYLPPLRLYLALSLAFFVIAGILARHSGGGGTAVVEVSPTSGKVAAQRVAMTPARARQVCDEVVQQMPWLTALGPRAEASCVTSISNGALNLDEALLHNVPRAMFLFLPLLGLVMKALYRRPPRHYVEHLLFFLHNHALIFLVLAVYALLGAMLPAAVMLALSAVLWLYVPWYFFVSMLRVYGQGRLATAGKLIVLSCAYVVLGGPMLAAITLYAMFTP